MRRSGKSGGCKRATCTKCGQIICIELKKSPSSACVPTGALTPLLPPQNPPRLRSSYNTPIVPIKDTYVRYLGEVFYLGYEIVVGSRYYNRYLVVTLPSTNLPPLTWKS